MQAIFLKELSHFFKTPAGYIYLAITLLVSGLFFSVFNLFSMSAGYADFLNRSQVIFFLTAPLLTMRLFASEKSHKTDQLLLTAPVHPLKIVLGKILAASVLLGITLLFFVLYLVVLGLLGYPDWSRALGGLLGYTLLGFSLICLGGFVSTCTESQLSSAIISFATIFLFWLLPSFSGLLPSNDLGQFIKEALLFLSLSTRYESFHLGVIEWANVAYYLAFSGFFILLSAFNLRLHSLKEGLKEKLNFALLAFILIMASLVMQKLGWKTDMTEEKLFSLDSQTTSLLQQLETPTSIIFLATDKEMNDLQFRQIDGVLGLYKTSPKVNYQILDPVANPSLLSRFTSEGDVLGVGYIIVSNDRFFKIINPMSLVSYNVGAKGVPEPASLNVESRVSSAIEFIGDGKTSQIYNLSGHGETQLLELTASGNNFATALENASYRLNPLNIAVNAIPSDADLILIINPLNDLSLYEHDQLKSYLKNSGRLFINLELNDNPMPNLHRLLNLYGVNMQKNTVAEFNTGALIPALNGNNWFFVAEMTDHPINRPLINRGATVIVGQTMNIDVNPLQNITYNSLLQSSNKAKIGYIKEGDRIEQVTGQATLALEIEAKTDQELSRFILFAGRLDLLLQADGVNWFLNAINFLNQTEGRVHIEDKSLYQLPLRFTGLLPVFLLAFVFVVALPLILLLMGIVVYLRRRAL